MFKGLRNTIQSCFNEVIGFMRTMTELVGNATKAIEELRDDVRYLKETIEQVKEKEE